MNIVIFGATGPTGQLLLQQGLSRDYDYTITAVARRPEAIELHDDRLRVVRGDVLDAASVEQAIAGQDAVIAVFGTGYTFKPVTLYSMGTQNIVNAMEKLHIPRLVAVTSGGTSPAHDASEGFVFGRIIKPIIGRTLYADMRRMEQIVMVSSLDWTIARPARLINTVEIGKYRVAEAYGLPNGSTTSRADLADFLLREVQSNQHLRQGIAITQ
jgi:putative NADH-flavin reductase